MRTRRCRVKSIREILCFIGYKSLVELHDAHCVGWYAIIGEYEFSDPEIIAANNSADRKTFPVWLNKPALLNIVSAANPLTRLRIIQHRMVAVDFMFYVEIVCV